MRKQSSALFFSVVVAALVISDGCGKEGRNPVSPSNPGPDPIRFPSLPLSAQLKDTDGNDIPMRAILHHLEPERGTIIPNGPLPIPPCPDPRRCIKYTVEVCMDETMKDSKDRIRDWGMFTFRWSDDGVTRANDPNGVIGGNQGGVTKGICQMASGPSGGAFMVLHILAKFFMVEGFVETPLALENRKGVAAFETGYQWATR